MNKLSLYTKKIIFYKFLECILYFLGVYSVIVNLCDIYRIDRVFSVVSFVFPFFHIYKNRSYLSFKGIFRKIERTIPGDYSIYNIFIKNESIEKYNFSQELVNAEIKRNSDFLESHDFIINYRNIVILFMVSTILYFSTFITQEFRKADNTPFVYEVRPGNTEVLFDKEIRFSIISNKNDIFRLNILSDERVQTIDPDEQDNLSLKMTDDIQYWFEGEFFRTDTYSVKIIYPLLLEKIGWKVRYPDYAGNLEKELTGKDLNVPENSYACARLHFNNSLFSLEIKGDSTYETAVVPENMEILVNRTENQRFEVIATDIYGQICTSEIIISVSEDNAPEINVIMPADKEIFIEKPFIPIKFSARDDFGLVSSRLRIVYHDDSEWNGDIGKYNTTSIIEEKTVGVRKNGVFQIYVSDRNTETASEEYSFRIIDDMDVMKEAYKSAENAEKGIENIKDELFSEIGKVGDLSEKVVNSGNISEKDAIEAEKIMENLENISSEGENILEELEKTEEFLKRNNAAKDVIEKIGRLRDTINELMGENIRNTINDLSQISGKKNMSYDEWKSFAESMDFDTLSKALENSLELFEKARKEQQEAALLELLEEMIFRLEKSAEMLDSVKYPDFGILKGIKINLSQIKDDFSLLTEFFGNVPEMVQVNGSFESILENIFSDREKAVLKMRENIEILKKFLSDRKKESETARQKEKDEIMDKLYEIYDFTLKCLENVNLIYHGYTSGKDIYSFSHEISDVKKNIQKILSLYEEILKRSFILDGEKAKDFMDVHVYMDNVWERGKESYRVDSYIINSEKRLYNSGLYILESLNRFSGMKSSTAIEEMLERLRELQKRQEQLGQEMMDLMQGESSIGDFMQYYAKMQNALRMKMQSLSGSGEGSMDDIIGDIMADMAEAERKAMEKELTIEELKENQDKIREKFRKMLLSLEEKTEKKEYKSKVSENEFEMKEGVTDTGMKNDVKKFVLPGSFPDIPDFIENIIREYMNGL